MCEAIYIGNTQKTFKKITDSHLYDILCLLKTDKNQNCLLPISDITLILLLHVETYTSAWC